MENGHEKRQHHPAHDYSEEQYQQRLDERGEGRYCGLYLLVVKFGYLCEQLVERAGLLADVYQACHHQRKHAASRQRIGDGGARLDTDL